jgi:colanic acid/amylovoran biosynthesis glycosyltransferase
MLKIVRSIYINAHILKYKLDWLHFGFTTMALEREFVAKAVGAKMAVSMRGFDIAIYPLRHQGCYSKVWSSVDKVHTISDDLVAKAYKTGLNERVKVSQITPAIDFSKFYHSRNSFSPAGKIRILSIGRLHWIKGFEYGLEAMAKLMSKGINFQYSIIGGGKELERLKFAVYQLGLEESVEFKGELTHDEVINELCSSDIYFQPSIHEGFCNAVLEAQAAGCLCVVSDTGGLSENVIDGKTGWTVAARNTDAFADRLESVIDLPENSKREIIETAQKRVKEVFSIEKQIKEFIDFYK